jgi:hypothetical protein
MWKRGGNESAHGPFFYDAGYSVYGEGIDNLGFQLGRKSWRLFFNGNDIRQEVFNIVYHLKQDITATWRLSTRRRREMWKKTESQYAFEEKHRPK